MRQEHVGQYPNDWHDIARLCKERAGWECERCGHPHDSETRHILTVHHLDCNKGNCRWWNLAALCQRCHLTIQARVVMGRGWMLPHTPWFIPHVAGYYAFTAGLRDDRQFVLDHADRLIGIGQGRITAEQFMEECP